jgi:hypothetical protein
MPPVKALLTLLLALFALPAFAEDWKTTDGKVYVNVKVVRVEDDAVTILDKDGGALVPLNKLDPTLQKRFSYDPVKAKAAADARAAADAANAKQLQAEMDLAKQIKLKQQIEAAKEKDEADGVTNAPTSP